MLTFFRSPSLLEPNNFFVVLVVVLDTPRRGTLSPTPYPLIQSFVTLDQYARYHSSTLEQVSIRWVDTKVRDMKVRREGYEREKGGIGRGIGTK